VADEERGVADRVISRADAVRAARRRFLEGSSLSMDDLANELAVSRATLYRVTSNRDLVLGDVIWGFGRRTLDQAAAEARASGARGVDRMLVTSRHFEDAIRGFEPLQRFIRDEPLVAFRVLFTSAGQVHQRTVEAYTELLDEAVASGELALPFEVTDFAYVYVRLGETLVYSDVLGGVDPDRDVAERVRRALFAAT
jgi:AcrR family transcriptional regulator